MQLNKNNPLLYIFGFFVVLMLIFLLAKNFSSQPKPSTQPSGNLPEYSLQKLEEESLAIFVENFISLYNSYSFEDFSNPAALGDYETENLQNKTATLLQTLEQTLAQGYEKRTTAIPATFSYAYPSADNLTATMEATVTQRLDFTTAPRSYRVRSTLKILRVGQGWVADDIQILEISQ